LSMANLSGADLSRADLSGADLIGADLSGAKGLTNEELEQQGLPLTEATMPNGQKYEEWLKSKGRGKDGKNSGS
jgi:Pentapeptide repeats (8 copies)